MSSDQRAFLAFVAPILGAAAIALLGMVWAAMHSAVARHTEKIDRHETRIQAVERNGAVAARELEHIRGAVDKIGVLIERVYDRDERERRLERAARGAGGE